jgi:hypothetical protein
MLSMECFSAGRRFHQDGAIMIVNGLFGIPTVGAMAALATNTFEADAAVVLGQGFTPGILMLLGVGLVGLGMWARKKIFQGTPIDGRYLALGGREVNFRETSLVSEEEERRKKMKRVMSVLTLLFVFSISAIAEMSTRQGNGMMSGGWWWGMNSGWVFMIISAILIILGIFLIMKRE